MKELDLIRYISGIFRTKKPIVKGIGDDCAVMDYKRDKYLLFTCDMLVEGTHFTRKVAPSQIGWKSVACSISDIASMGGVPKYALVSVGIPRKKGSRYLIGLMKGIKKICRRFGISVIGGDTNASRHLVIDVSMIGEVEKANLITRDGARVGDFIFVTGAIGEGRRKHLDFLPRIREARILAENYGINAMIDLSDGLAMDLFRIARASRVGACIYKSLIPLSDRSAPLERAIDEGEDFELLFTASVGESRKIIMRMGEKADLPVTLIGEILPQRMGIQLVEEHGKVTMLNPEGYRHL